MAIIGQLKAKESFFLFVVVGGGGDLSIQSNYIHHGVSSGTAVGEYNV